MTEKELNEQKKEYLDSYKKLCRKIQSLEEQMMSLQETEQAPKIQTITDMPRGSKQTDLSDYIVKVENLVSKITKLKEERLEKRLEIENLIADVEDGVESAVLHKRYIEFKPWERVCVEIDYSWMQTHRIHSRALKNIMI